MSSQLVKWGFKINPYNFCISNKTINGKQCTVAWHVDHLKVSHIKGKVVTSIFNLLDGIYGQQIVDGKQAAITIRCGKLHDYLGVTLDFSKQGHMKIDMREYLQKVLAKMPDNMNGTAKTPAADHVFQIVEGIELLSSSDSEFFHATVAKLPFLCKRGRPNIQTATAFLCTGVQQPTRHNYNKLSQTIKYLRNTANLVLRLGANNLNILKWWVGASYGVHHNMRSHTGGAMSMSTDAVYSTSRHQKLNTKSSTKAKLVGIDNVLLQALWTKYFMEEQGYGVLSIVVQDNQSTMKLAENGRASCGKGSRHINIRYFFITDRIASKDITIQYCPTKDMVADYLTKPLQSKLFYKFCDQRMGVVPLDTIVGDHRSVLDQNVTKIIENPKSLTKTPTRHQF